MTRIALTDAERKRIADAVAAAEARTSVELRLVLAAASSQYGAFAVIYPALATLFAGGIAAAFTDLDAAWLFVGEAALFAAGVALLQWHRLRRALAPSHAKHKAAWRQARLQYAAIGLQNTVTRHALLLFCSVAERYVEILVDETVARAIPDSVWQSVVDRFKTGLQAGRPAEAFVGAAKDCADILAKAFPAQPGETNDLPDALVEV